MKKHWSSKNLLDWHRFRRLVGVQFASLALAVSVVSYPTHAFDYHYSSGVEIMGEAEDVVTTATYSTFEFPLESTLGMSQSYHGLHPGVDLRANRGTGVLAMAEGTVAQVEKIWGGYGHYVRIAHKGTLSTLYAHLDEVYVVPGQKVTGGEKIGTVGMTGWTTGPHLHLEVTLGERAVNPLSYFSINSK